MKASRESYCRRRRKQLCERQKKLLKRSGGGTCTDGHSGGMEGGKGSMMFSGLGWSVLSLPYCGLNVYTEIRKPWTTKMTKK